ncbi:hypothetical protein F2P81_005510 [Scophthalmus maximus]|uniref:AT-rich interactive domain-containing protein 3 n=1 Tax=Scophthalmus maximus TaxID=52904 RepID=A0A6A4TC52_SCOMX|nr:hypothetical protein F2P81_005510 [Scophthalmus maximus]
MVILTENHEEQDYILIEERKCSSLPSSPAKRVSPTKKKQFYINQAIRNSDLTPRAKGKKSLRRQENTRFLANLLERDECSKDDLEVCSNPSIPSIFTEACTNGNFIEPWNDFMNCSGEEQERLLSLLEQDEAKKKTLSRLLKDPRNVNPAFTAQECFQRIDRRLRATLKRKQIPMGTLEVLEENLLSFFNTQPRSVYTTNLASRHQLRRVTSDRSGEQTRGVSPSYTSVVCLSGADELRTTTTPWVLCTALGDVDEERMKRTEACVWGTEREGEQLNAAPLSLEMKLQAVMENLHRQQRAKLLMEQQLQQQAAGQHIQVRTGGGGGDEPMGIPAPEAEQAQMAALAAMRAAAAGLQRVSDSPMSERSSGGEEEVDDDDNEEGEEQYKDMMGSDEEEQIKRKWDEEDFEGEMEEDFDDDLGDEGLPTGHDAVAPGKGILLLPHRQLHPHSQLLKARPSVDQEPRVAILPTHATHSHLGGQDHGDWTYEEQFRQNNWSMIMSKLASLPPSLKEREEKKNRRLAAVFLKQCRDSVLFYDVTVMKLPVKTEANISTHFNNVDINTLNLWHDTIHFSINSIKELKPVFTLYEGTPVNRIPIMAKQVLDLYMLYRLVTEKGGLVEVINKKLWREITKGLNLPTSITSAAFTLRTQYMKYLYPYECDKRGLSNPNELQAAIDSNRREGRRQSFGSSLFTYSPNGTPTMLSSPKLPTSMGVTMGTNGASLTPIQKIKKEEGCQPLPGIGMARLQAGALAGHSVAAVQAVAAQAAMAAQMAALEQLRDKLEAGEPPEKKMALQPEDHHRLLQRALQHNLLAMTAQIPMNIRINNQDGRQDSALNLTTNGTGSISMSVELNGVVYTGVLFAQAAAGLASSGVSGLSVSNATTGGRIAPQQQQQNTPTSNSNNPLS